jgi:hypothetical protein
MEQDEHVKHVTSSHTSQYKWGTSVVPHLTQLVEPITAYQLPVLLCFENEQNLETGLMYFVPNLLYNVNLV